MQCHLHIMCNYVHTHQINQLPLEHLVEQVRLAVVREQAEPKGLDLHLGTV